MVNVSQFTLNGDNTLEIHYKISIDVERLQEIVRNDSENIKNLLCELTDDIADSTTDNDSIKIEEKNIKNDLVEFYNEWIKEEEGKFNVIREFIADNDLYNNVDKASKNLRQIIYAYQNKKNHMLTAEIFTILIQEHTKNLDNDSKDVMVLLLYFLYRMCFIGDK